MVGPYGEHGDNDTDGGGVRAHRWNCKRMAVHIRMIVNLLEMLKSTEVVWLPETKEHPTYNPSPLISVMHTLFVY